MDYPASWTASFKLEDCKTFFLRPEHRADTELLWEMFSTLSEKSLSNLRPLFTRERVQGWTNDIDYDKVLTIVALYGPEREQRIVGTATLKVSDEKSARTAELSITVHDEYQNKGLGTALLNHLLGIAKTKNLKKLWLSVNATNDRAVHLYLKVGFKVEGKCTESCFDEKSVEVHRMTISL